MLILFVAYFFWYAYRLFAWDDLLPLSIGDIAYMIPFTLGHIAHTIVSWIIYDLDIVGRLFPEG